MKRRIEYNPKKKCNRLPKSPAFSDDVCYIYRQSALSYIFAYHPQIRRSHTHINSLIFGIYYYQMHQILYTYLYVVDKSHCMMLNKAQIQVFYNSTIFTIYVYI